MNVKRFMLAACACCLVAGCKSYGPQFDARQDTAAQANQGIATSRHPDPVDLEESLFASVNSTNEIRPDWLKPPPDFFTLGPGDTIEIEVLGEANSAVTALVGPDGRIYYSLLPGLFVWGRTLGQARDLLEQELGKFLRVKPAVAVTLRSVASKRIWVLGSVQAPGVYSLATPMTLLEVLAAAGGTAAAPGAKSGLPDLLNSFLLREGRLVKVDFHRLLSQGDLSQNLYVQPDDFLYLRSATVRNIYVLGAVGAPTIVPYADGTTLVSAIAGAGGTLPYARGSHVAIVRGSIAHPRIAFVNYRAITRGDQADVRLEPGDIVYVSFVFYQHAAVFAEQVVNQFARSIAANEGQRAAGGAGIGGSISVSGP
ncbi:MAG: SLBB domain-containing protein [Verrucomicrobia bacterium]|nr:SLBB domain-containing protein [Verrucomicrobiota bacterium]